MAPGRSSAGTGHEKKVCRTGKSRRLYAWFVQFSGFRRFLSTTSLSYRIGSLPLYNYFFLSGWRELHQHEYSFLFVSDKSLIDVISSHFRNYLILYLHAARSFSCLHLEFWRVLPLINQGLAGSEQTRA